MGSVAGRARHRRSGRRLGAPGSVADQRRSDDPTAYAARDNELDLSALDELDPADNVAGNVARINADELSDRPPNGPTEAPGDGPTEASRDDPRGERRTTGHGDPARRRARRGGARTTVSDSAHAATSAPMPLGPQLASRCSSSSPRGLSWHAYRRTRSGLCAGQQQPGRLPPPPARVQRGHVCGCAQPTASQGRDRAPGGAVPPAQGGSTAPSSSRSTSGSHSAAARREGHEAAAGGGKPPRRLRRERNSLPISSAGKSGASPMTTAA